MTPGCVRDRFRSQGRTSPLEITIEQMALVHLSAANDDLGMTSRVPLRLALALSLLAVACDGDDSASPPTGDASTSTSPAASSAPPSTLQTSTSTSTVEPTATSTDAPASTTTPTTSAPPSTTSPAATSTILAPAERLVLAAYLVRGEKIALVHRSVPYTLATSRAAIEQLLSGPTPAEQTIDLVTTVPSDVALNDVTISPDGIATVDLSAAFEAGGGSLSMTLRLAQVVYTLTQFSSVSGVLFEIDGRPIREFGGEGIVIDHPLTRADFEDVTPAILVDDPAPFDRVTSPVRVTGTANVFEAVFLARLTDSTGRVLYEGAQMATSGSGTRGTFDFTVDAAGAQPGMATLRVWEPSAKDGSDTNVVEIPLELT